MKICVNKSLEKMITMPGEGEVNSKTCSSKNKQNHAGVS